MSYITELAIAVNKEEEKIVIAEGFIKTDVPLGPDPIISLWYKRGNGPAITRIQFSFNDPMAKGLIVSGFLKIDKNLNPGGNAIYLWYYRGSSHVDVPIVEIMSEETAENDVIGFTWEIVPCYPGSQGSDGDMICMWVKKAKPMYLCDITATETLEVDAYLLQQGYTRIDVAINGAAAGVCVFIWYRATTESAGAITDLTVSPNDVPHYMKVNQNLTEGIGTDPWYLWYTRDAAKKNPIKAFSLVPEAVKTYKKAGIQVIPISGVPIHLYLIR